MDFQKAEPGGDDLETSLNPASAGTGLPVCLSEALADPIVKVLMAADGVDPKGLEELLRPQLPGSRCAIKQTAPRAPHNANVQ